MFPKTSPFLSTINICKSYIGLGMLTVAYGFKQVGFLPATLFIFVNCFTNIYTINL